jgi:hypothetical protein
MQYKCPKCDNGWCHFEEDGRPVTDVCYHCGNTGWIDPDTYFKDRIEGLAEVLAVTAVDNERKHCDSNPDGEGWGFMAAEHGCSEYEFTQGAYYNKTATIMNELKDVHDKHPNLLRTLLNHIVPDDNPQIKYEDEVC